MGTAALDFMGNPIPERTQLKGNRTLSVFYPGMGYSLDAPLFFYLREVLAENGMDLLQFNYRYNENQDFLNARPEVQTEWIEHDGAAMASRVRTMSASYDRVVHVGKSLGTTMLMLVAKLGALGPHDLVVWLTPGSYARDIVETSLGLPQHQFFAVGTADRYYEASLYKAFAERPDIEVLKIRGAGHVLEDEASLKRSITHNYTVIKAVSEFLGITCN